MGKYSAREMTVFNTEARELNIFQYCPTIVSAIIDLLYDF